MVHIIISKLGCTRFADESQLFTPMRPSRSRCRQGPLLNVEAPWLLSDQASGSVCNAALVVMPRLHRKKRRGSGRSRRGRGSTHGALGGGGGQACRHHHHGRKSGAGRRSNGSFLLPGLGAKEHFPPDLLLTPSHLGRERGGGGPMHNLAVTMITESGRATAAILVAVAEAQQAGV